MRYISTRGQAPDLTFGEAMLTGLARDGGLYVPAEIPVWTHQQIADLAGLSYEEVAFRVMKPFCGETFTDAELHGAIAKAYAGFGHAARAPLVQLAPGHFLLELFHGPTLAFKDFAMQIIGQLFQIALSKDGRKITIVGATSGDTGSAAIEAFRGLDNVDVFILFPHGRVSDVQRRQMTTPSENNVHALAMDGDFDDCQGKLKDMFNHFEFRDAVGLAGVNSINWARVLAQVVYYFTAAVSLGAPDRKISFTVPTGNFGDIFAGYAAKRMGLPIGKLVIATNENDILSRTLKTGRYEMKAVKATTSPSMDIQISSNFERLLFEASGRNAQSVRAAMDGLKQSGSFEIEAATLKAIRRDFRTARASEKQVADTIRATLADAGYLADPHTAIGVFVAKKFEKSDSPMVTLSTAHPAKFPAAVKKASGIDPALPLWLAGMMDKPERFDTLDAEIKAVQAHIGASTRAGR